MEKKILIFLTVFLISSLFSGCGVIPYTIAIAGFWRVTSLSTTIGGDEPDLEEFPREDGFEIVQPYLLFINNTFSAFSEVKDENKTHGYLEHEGNYSIKDRKVILENGFEMTFTITSKTLTLAFIDKNPYSKEENSKRKIVIRATRDKKSIMDGWEPINSSS